MLCLSTPANILLETPKDMVLSNDMEVLEGRKPFKFLVESTCTVYTLKSAAYLPCKTLPTPLEFLLDVRLLD